MANDYNYMSIKYFNKSKKVWKLQQHEHKQSNSNNKINCNNTNNNNNIIIIINKNNNNICKIENRSIKYLKNILIDVQKQQ